MNALWERFGRLVRELGKFGVVGGVSYVIDLTFFNLFLGPLGGIGAKIASTVIAATCAFIGNRFWTWRDRERSGLRREYLLYFFLPKKDREHIPGDLAEEYNTILVPKFGLASARRWYWKQVFTSVWPVVGPRLGGLLAVGGLALSWLLRTLRRLF